MMVDENNSVSFRLPASSFDGLGFADFIVQRGGSKFGFVGIEITVAGEEFEYVFNVFRFDAVTLGLDNNEIEGGGGGRLRYQDVAVESSDVCVCKEGPP